MFRRTARHNCVAHLRGISKHCGLLPLLVSSWGRNGSGSVRCPVCSSRSRCCAVFRDGIRPRRAPATGSGRPRTCHVPRLALVNGPNVGADDSPKRPGFSFDRDITTCILRQDRFPFHSELHRWATAQCGSAHSRAALFGCQCASEIHKSRTCCSPIRTSRQKTSSSCAAIISSACGRNAAFISY